MNRICLSLFVSFFTSLLLPAANWPAWRGPTGDGICTEKDLPVKWSATNNVKWRVTLPERGNSTPIIWGDRVFITQSIGSDRLLLCLDRKDGKELWRAGAKGVEPEPTHGTNPFCSGSAITDGERVIVFFASAGLWCFDMNGKELWRRDLGVQHHIWGAGPSPVIHGDLCILNFGPGERTFLIAVDKKTGKTVWQNDEPGGDSGDPKAGGRGKWTGSWTTPVLFKEAGREALLMSWPSRLCSLDPKTGKEHWSTKGINPLVYTSPLHAGGVAVAMGGFNGMAVAVRTGGSGDVTESHRLWQHPRTKQRIGSGVVHEGHVYIHNDPGVAECFDLQTGKLVWEERLKGAGGSGVNWSSVMLAGGNCYTITQGGDCFVFKASPKFELLSANSLREPSNSSIAASNGDLFIRTHKTLWCIGAK